MPVTQNRRHSGNILPLGSRRATCGMGADRDTSVVDLETAVCPAGPGRDRRPPTYPCRLLPRPVRRFFQLFAI